MAEQLASLAITQFPHGMPKTIQMEPPTWQQQLAGEIASDLRRRGGTTPEPGSDTATTVLYSLLEGLDPQALDPAAASRVRIAAAHILSRFMPEGMQ